MVRLLDAAVFHVYSIVEPTPSVLRARAGPEAQGLGQAFMGWAFQKVKPEPEGWAQARPGQAWA